MPDQDALTKSIAKTQPMIIQALEAMSNVIIGQEEVLRSLWIGLLSDGHILLEGVPGLAKTMAVRTLSHVVDVPCTRIQFTPDLLPADLLGTSIYHPHKGTFSIKKGPIFTSFLLADEINRAPAKVQSALLEVMQERQVTLAGETFPVEQPYMVLATQNPIEQAGTYPLPEAQTDRFMLKVKIDYPSFAEEKGIVEKMGSLRPVSYPKPVLSKETLLEARSVVDSLFIDEKVIDYILHIVFSTRTPAAYRIPIEGYLEFGSSPRASLALQLCSKAHAFLEGRAYVTPDDVKHVAHPVLRHRMRLSYEAEAEGKTADDIIDTILDNLLVP